MAGQDNVEAKELYGMAETEGVIQVMINLGSICERSRAGEPDHAKAFMQFAEVFIQYAKALMQFAKVAAICDAPEALYKLGDMHSRTTAKRCFSDKMLIYCKCLNPQ